MFQFKGIFMKQKTVTSWKNLIAGQHGRKLDIRSEDISSHGDDNHKAAPYQTQTCSVCLASTSVSDVNTYVHVDYKKSDRKASNLSNSYHLNMQDWPRMITLAALL